jgi:hypothetical protein
VVIGFRSVKKRKKTRGGRGKLAVAPWGETRVTRGDLDLGTPTRLLFLRPASQPPTVRSPLSRNPPAVLSQSHAWHEASGAVLSSGGGALTAGCGVSCGSRTRCQHSPYGRARRCLHCNDVSSPRHNRQSKW